MRPPHNKLKPSATELREFLRGRNPYSLREIMVFFDGEEEEVQYALFLAVQLGYLVYYPPRRKAKGRWTYNKAECVGVPTPRISPLEPKGELKYDLYSHARLSSGFRRQ
jgi:hypothetical protein